MIMRSMPKTKLTVSPWMSRLLTFCLGALAAASVVAWALKVQGLQSTVSVVPVGVAAAPQAEPAMVARALGALSKPAADGADAEAPVLESSRFVLVGVVASGARGAALIAVDGKPAKPYSVGSTVGDTFVLQSVQAHQAVLGKGAAGSASAQGQVTLAMPLIGDKKPP